MRPFLNYISYNNCQLRVEYRTDQRVGPEKMRCAVYMLI